MCIGLMKHIEAIIFDLGGTLIEYASIYATWPELEEPGLRAAYKILQHNQKDLPDFNEFKDMGLAILPDQWHQATLGNQNLTVQGFLADIQTRLGYQSPEPGLLALAAHEYEQAVCAGAAPIPGGYEVLTELKQAGLKLGLISNTMFSSQAHLEDLIKFNLAHFFETTLFSAETNKWKPTAAPFQQVLSALETEPEAAIFIGDDPRADVLGARNAGIQVIHFMSSQRFPSYDGLLPDATIHHLHELAQTLAKLDGRSPLNKQSHHEGSDER